MRIRTVASIALLALALASCGGDDTGTSSASGSASGSVSGSASVDEETTDDEATVDEEETIDPASDDDLQARVDAAQLEAADLGTGWELTSTTPAGDDSDENEPNPTDECVDQTVQDRFDAAKVAESEERTFSQQSEDGLVPSTVSSQSEAIDDESLFEDMHEILRSDEFAVCFKQALETLMSQQASGDPSQEMTIGDVEVTGDVVDVDDADSTRLAVPVTASASGITLDLVFGITFVNVGPIGVNVFAFGADGAISADQEATWAGLLAERAAGA